MLRFAAPLFVLAASLCHTTCLAGQIYKYQDENGKWHFSEKKYAPPSAESVNISVKKNTAKPSLELRQQDGLYSLVAINPYHGPLEVGVDLEGLELENLDDQDSKTLTGEKQRYLRKVLGPDSEAVIVEGLKSEAMDYPHNFTSGDPRATPDNTLYYPPVENFQAYEVSQAFQGEYSHTKEPSLYAVDIAIPVGEPVIAARQGTVMYVRDTYHIGGTNQFFADKANMIHVLHDDGTIGVYAHIMMGSARVEKGQSVNAGDILGLVGNTGYSAGPHLHFVVWRNNQGQQVSVPFQFVDASGKAFTPQKGQLLVGHK